MATKHIYKVMFHQQGSLYELYARSVSHGEMYGFLEIGEIIFGERSALLVDPAEEKLKAEFSGVKRTYVPIGFVVRVDEVEKEGVNKLHPGDDSGTNISQFPIASFAPTSGPQGPSSPGDGGNNTKP